MRVFPNEDSPETCLADILRLHASYITKAGGVIDPSPAAPRIEISPLVSYDGEDLEYVKGKNFTSPMYIAH